MKKQLVIVSIFLILVVQLSADANTTKKNNEMEMENSEFITLQEFDAWLKVNDHYEAFVKAYNTSPDHPIVIKMKCLYELESLYDGVEIPDEIRKKCG